MRVRCVSVLLACVLATVTCENNETHLDVNSCRADNQTCVEIDELFGEEEACLGGSGLDIRETQLAKNLFQALPPFAVTSSEATNPKCFQDSQIFLKQLNRLEMWALKMFDSSAKLPSSILRGNVIQYGDFDQCLSVNSGYTTQITGKYCLASLQVQVSSDLGRLEEIHKLAHAYFMFQSTFEDPGHRVPRFSSVQWGLCVPASCQASDVHQELENIVQSHLGTDTGLQVRIKVDPEMCQVKQRWSDVPFSAWFVGIFFLAVIAVSILSSLFTEESEQKPGVIMQFFRAFSLRKNLSELLDVSTTRDEVGSANGVRVINAYMLLVSHKSMALIFNPYVNRTSMTEWMTEPIAVLARGAALYTDPFVMLSGLLTSYTFLGQFNKKGWISLPHEYISRIFRLLPNLAAVILFCTFVLPWVWSGPQWSLVINEHSNICKQNWWRNLLFIHNYFGFENMCLTHTHHLGIDMQLFFISPFLTYILWRWPKAGGSTLLLIATFSTYLRYHVTYSKHLGLFILFGTSVSQMFRTANLSYILPTHRLTTYILGIFLGYVLRHCGKEFKIKKLHLAVGWTLAGLFFYLSVLEPAHMGAIGYAYDPTDAANYAAFAPILFSLVFAWLIFVSHTGNGGMVGRAFSWPWLKVATRISYALYLTQFPVFFFNVGRTRSAGQYEMPMLINLWETVVILAASVLLTLLFEIPFQNMKKILVKKR